MMLIAHIPHRLHIPHMYISALEHLIVSIQKGNHAEGKSQNFLSVSEIVSLIGSQIFQFLEPENICSL